MAPSFTSDASRRAASLAQRGTATAVRLAETAARAEAFRRDRLHTQSRISAFRASTRCLAPRARGSARARGRQRDRATRGRRKMKAIVPTAAARTRLGELESQQPLAGDQIGMIPSRESDHATRLDAGDPYPLNACATHQSTYAGGPAGTKCRWQAGRMHRQVPRTSSAKAGIKAVRESAA
jgi:hypothetical protein